MNIVYLDFDGVVHDDAVFLHPKRGIYLDAPGRTLFEWMPIVDELLTPHPDVKLVLSTSWVRDHSFEYAKKQLSPSLQNRVIGATFHHREMQKSTYDMMSRGVQVWTDVLRRHPTSWLAIDNDDDGWPVHCRGRLIKTDDRQGLSDNDVQIAIREMLGAFKLGSIFNAN
ncbi:MAG: HAD domain-containing protein [Undibacterium sp.]|uniref:HAD domain-containing protein n=1 Tax=Undibacterium sp. TaxID=1914977 RepID=UPI00271FC213|nr:HAD domain-containing protein [Undibacterium sp.]MDO8653467.1 HAD domain-containing protein [Undibacterium sp.]